MDAPVTPPRRRIPLLLLPLLAAAACVSTGGASTDPDVITRAELEELQELTAYAAVVRLRPRWLRPRGQVSMSGQVFAAVVIEGTERGEIDRLRSLHVSQVGELRFLDAREATLRYGTGFPGGIILVALRR